MKTADDCKHRYMSWVGDGDRRLLCKCGAYFIIVDGVPTKISEGKD